mmetsp:Transcript_11544/g.30043  ORF Transcript_11544/g.30043 Transcript_11544/m.30043 type:complete len:322 (+) Transcript_11544:532-1497(+)
MELREMRRVECLVAEDAIDREVLAGFETATCGRLLGELRKVVERARRDGGGVRAQQVLAALLFRPVVPPARGAKAALRVHALHGCEIFRRHLPRARRLLDEEGVVHVARWVLLRLEERIEVPKRRLDETVGLHLLEAHLEEDLTELSAHLHQRVEVAAPRVLAQRLQVDRLERVRGPRPLRDHLRCQVSSRRLARAPIGKCRARHHLEAGLGRQRDQLALLERIGHILGNRVGTLVAYGDELLLNGVLDSLDLTVDDWPVSRLLDPHELRGHGLGHALFGDSAKLLHQLRLRNAGLGDGREDLRLGTPNIRVLRTLLSEPH